MRGKMEIIKKSDKSLFLKNSNLVVINVPSMLLQDNLHVQVNHEKGEEHAELALHNLRGLNIGKFVRMKNTTRIVQYV